MVWKMTAVMSLLLGGASCSVFNSSCEDLCLDLQVMAELGPNFNQAVYERECAALGRGSCTDCWRSFSELLVEYNSTPDCFCSVPAEERDPDIEAIFQGGCDGLIEEFYAGDPSLLDEECTCE